MPVSRKKIRRRSSKKITRRSRSSKNITRRPIKKSPVKTIKYQYPSRFVIPTIR